MLSCVCWVRRGVAKEVPDRIRLSNDELQELLVEAKHQTTESTGGSDACAIVASSSAGNDSDDDGMQVEVEEKDSRTEAVTELDDEIDRLYMAGYDDDEPEGVRMDGAGMAGLTYYATNDDDPYITLKGEADENENENIKINSHDNLIVYGKADGDMSTLDIDIYNADEDVLFTHHSILLSAFPLAVEWLDYDPHPENEHGNYVAVGTMEPVIEVWDLDVIDEMEPVFVLGSKQKKSKSKKKYAQGHSDAVMTLSWNKSVRNVLASGSADHTIQLWDMLVGESVHTITHHSGKVQSVMWHPYEANSLVSGSMDKTARVYDCRNPDSSVKSWSFQGEVEKVLWNHLDPYHFLVSTDSGFVMGVDVRKDSPLFTLHAHESAVTALCLSPEIPGCLLTASDDKTVKVWDIKDYRPTHVSTTDLKLGPVLCASFCPDVSLVVAVGGQKNGLTVRNLADAAQVQKHFQSRERVMPVTIDDSEDSKRDIQCQVSPLPPTSHPDQLEGDQVLKINSKRRVTSSMPPKHVRTSNILAQKKRKKKQKAKTRMKET